MLSAYVPYAQVRIAYIDQAYILTDCGNSVQPGVVVRIVETLDLFEQRRLASVVKAEKKDRVLWYGRMSLMESESGCDRSVPSLLVACKYSDFTRWYISGLSSEPTAHCAPHGILQTGLLLGQSDVSNLGNVDVALTLCCRLKPEAVGLHAWLECRN